MRQSLIKKYLPKIPANENIINILNTSNVSQFPHHGTIKVISWNVHKGSHKRFNQEFQKISNMCDLLLLQEHFDTQSFIVPDILEKDVVTATSFYKKDNISTGVCTISSIKHSDQKFIQSNVREPLLRTPKLTLITDYNIKFSFQKLKVINLHGINFVTAKKYNSHMSQIVEEMQKHTGPMIIAGDFNSWGKKRKNILVKIIYGNKLTEIKFEQDNRKIVLDHIFINKGKAIHAKMLNEFITSDHKPLYFEYEY